MALRDSPRFAHNHVCGPTCQKLCLPTAMESLGPLPRAGAVMIPKSRAVFARVVGRGGQTLYSLLPQPASVTLSAAPFGWQNGAEDSLATLFLQI